MIHYCSLSELLKYPDLFYRYTGGLLEARRQRTSKKDDSQEQWSCTSQSEASVVTS